MRVEDLEFGMRVRVHADVWRLAGPKWNYQWSRSDKGRYVQPFDLPNLDKLPGDPIPALSGRSWLYKDEPGSDRFSIRFRKIPADGYPAIITSLCIKLEGHIIQEVGFDYQDNFFCQEGRLQLVELMLAKQPLTTRPLFVLALPEDIEPE